MPHFASIHRSTAEGAGPACVADGRIAKAIADQIRISPAGTAFRGSLAHWQNQPPRLQQVQDLYAELRQDYSAVLIEAPPVLADPLITALSSMADGVILLVEGERTRRSAMARSTDTLQDSDANILGVIYVSSRSRLPEVLDRIV